jgi:hypothetical protein
MQQNKNIWILFIFIFSNTVSLKIAQVKFNFVDFQAQIMVNRLTDD